MFQHVKIKTEKIKDKSGKVTSVKVIINKKGTIEKRIFPDEKSAKMFILEQHTPS